MVYRIFLIFTTLITLISNNSYSNPTLEVRVFLNEKQCLYCYNPLTTLNGLPDDVSLTFFTNSNSIETWKELFNQMRINKQHSFKEYNKPINKNIVGVYQGNSKLLTCSLEALPEIVPNIYSLSQNLILKDSILLEGVTLSSRNSIDIQDNHIVLSDYLLNSAHTIDLSSKEIQKIKGPDFNKKDFLDLINYDKEEYEKLLPTLEKQNLDKVKIASVFYRKDTLTILSTLNIPETHGNNTALRARFFIGNYSNKKWTDLYLAESSITTDERMYGIFNKVYRHNNYFITNLITPNLENQNHVWGKFEKNENQLSADVLKYYHPEIEVPKQPYAYSLMGVRDDWLFLKAFPVAYNPKTKSTLNYTKYLQDVDINKPLNLSTSSLKIVDFYYHDQAISVIYKNEEAYFLTKINTSINQTLFTKTLHISENLNPNTLRIISENNYSALSKDRKKVFILSSFNNSN